MDLAEAAVLIDLATTAQGFIAAATTILEASGLADVELFAMDHEVRHLVSLSPASSESDGHESVKMTEAVLSALSSGGESHAENMVWLALPTRQQPLLVARASRVHPDFHRPIGALVGEVYAQRRTQQFDLEQPRRRSHMSLAAELQWSLLPQMSDANDVTSLAAALRPAYDVAGDAFDYQIDDRFVRAYALDAMGHGVTATLSSSLALTAIRNARYQGADLPAQLSAAHEAVLAEWGGDRFVTGVAVESSPERLMVVNAGHEPLRRRSLDGSIKTLDLAANPPMGAPHSVGYDVIELEPLAPGEGLALLSDGAPNNRSSTGASLGSRGVDLALGQSWSSTPFETVHRFLATVNAHLDSDNVDDVTALVMVAR